MLKRTPLFEQHLQNQALMQPYFGWSLPAQYGPKGSSEQEHVAVKQHAGISEGAYLSIVDVVGVPARQFLRDVFSNDVDRMVARGRGQQSLLLNHQAEIMDSVWLYCLSPTHYRLIMGCGTHQRTIQWLRELSVDASIGLHERLELATVVVQGPAAIPALMQILNPVKQDALLTLQLGEAIDVYGWFFMRSHCIHEEKLTILLPVDQVIEFWNDALRAGFKPFGLTAMDSLRIEAGQLAYGQDINEHTSLHELGPLDEFVVFAPENRHFIGRHALSIQIQKEPKKQIMGFVCLSKESEIGLGDRVMIHPKQQGVVTSVAYSPSLGQTLGFVRVPWHLEGADVSVPSIQCSDGQVCSVRFVPQSAYCQGLWS